MHAKKDMEREQLESLLIDYIDGQLAQEARLKVEELLSKDSEALILYGQLKTVTEAMERAAKPLEPSAKLKSSFELLLQQEIASAKGSKTISLWPRIYRIAASVALLILAGAIGFWISQYRQQEDQIAALKEDLEKTKALMLSRLDNQQSPSQRIMGVMAAYEVAAVDTEIVEALVRTLNEDPNTNVRLAALDALGKFHTEPLVRKALINSLSTQADPVVQIALIQLMVEMKEKEAMKPLQRIIDNEESLPVVKDEAHVGLFKLS